MIRPVCHRKPTQAGAYEVSVGDRRVGEVVKTGDGWWSWGGDEIMAKGCAGSRREAVRALWAAWIRETGRT